MIFCESTMAMVTVRWKDICPWIEGANINPEVSLLSEEVVPTQLSDSASLDTVLSYIEGDLDLVPLYEVFPNIDPESLAESLTLRPRNISLLRRNRLLKMSSILGRDLRTLGEMRNAGPMFCRDLLEGLVLSSVFAMLFGGGAPRKVSGVGPLRNPQQRRYGRSFYEIA